MAEDLGHEALECVGTARAQRALRVRIGVDVDDRFLIQLVGVLLGPFGGAEEPELLAVPEREHYCPLRLPTLFVHLAERASGFDHRPAAPHGALCPIDPAT